MKKESYYQGTEEPKPGKQQYKPEKTKPVTTRFKTPFFRNYDYIDNPTGPGAGWNEMSKYKSISEFLKAKRKRNKDKYKADDIEISENKKDKIQARLDILSQIIKQAIDFPIDEQVSPIVGDSESYVMPSQLGPAEDLSTFPGAANYGEFEAYPSGAQLGGFTDHKLFPDEEDRDPSALNYGRDYSDDDTRNFSHETSSNLDVKHLETLLEQYLNPKETDVFGLPDGISPSEDLDTVNVSSPQNQYGILDDGNIELSSPANPTGIIL